MHSGQRTRAAAIHWAMTTTGNAANTHTAIQNHSRSSIIIDQNIIGIPTTGNSERMMNSKAAKRNRETDEKFGKRCIGRKRSVEGGERLL